jgi:hypothetical protein
MVKKYLIGTFLLSCLFVHSQDNKGKFMIRGSAGYSNSNIIKKYPQNNGLTDEYKTNLVSADVNFGYFLSNNFAVGISGAVNHFKFINKSNNLPGYTKYGNTYSEKGAGIFARYNRTLHKSKFGVFLQLNAQYYWINEIDISTTLNANGKPENVTKVTKGTRIQTNLNPGLIYFINNKFSVESTLGSLYYSVEQSKSTTMLIKKKNIKTGADFSLTNINLGFTYYF